MALLKHLLIDLGSMQLITFLVMPLHLAATGRIGSENNSSTKAILNCIFPESFMKTDFAVRFYYEHGRTELLVDCVWLGDKLECVEQQGFKCRLPVPGTAEIEVPQRFVTRPSKIGYTLNGDDPSNVNFCHFVGNRSEEGKESQNKKHQNNIKDNNFDHKASSDFPPWIIGLVIGTLFIVVVSVTGIVLRRNIYRRNIQTQTSEESNVESPSLVSTENSRRDDNSSQPTVKDPLVSSSTKQSSLPDDEEDRASHNSQSVKDDYNILVCIPEKKMLAF